MSPCRYGNDINKTIHFEKNWKNVTKKVFVPSTSPELIVIWITSPENDILRV
jgi:hypothetical protein